MEIAKPNFLLLLILDGWGLAPPGPGNAITLAKTPNFTKLWNLYPHTQLAASGEAVGLPKGIDGNSETGHLNIGGGRVVYQDLPRIDLEIAKGSFFSRPAFLEAINHVKKFHSCLNLMGLSSDAGIHSHINHLFSLLKLARDHQVKKINLHLFTDGRDTSPISSLSFLKRIEEEVEKAGTGQICTLIGRYFAMDRDNRWSRTQMAYDLLTLGKGKKFSSVSEAVNNSYQQGKTDEFLQPSVIVKDNGQPKGVIEDNDAIIFFNFRNDRPRQLTRAFVLNNVFVQGKRSFDPYSEFYPSYDLESVKEAGKFKREKFLKNLYFVTMTEYEPDLPVAVAYEPIVVQNCLSWVISERGLNQLHIAETEKFPHVTYFFNGGRESKFAGEVQMKINSPKVATYDLQPQMSIFEVTEALLEKIKSGSYDFILVNFANPDMVGHTGVLNAGIKACEFTDQCLGKVVQECLKNEGVCVVMADHGNAEEMLDPVTGSADTEHSSNPVPFLVIHPKFEKAKVELASGVLGDVAPTILNLLRLPIPDEMTGHDLFILAKQVKINKD